MSRICWKNIPDCFGAKKQMIRMPMVIVMIMKAVIATARMIEFGVDERQRFLTKRNKIMFDIRRKRHTQSI
jgi:hypothetical protein